MPTEEGWKLLDFSILSLALQTALAGKPYHGDTENSQDRYSYLGEELKGFPPEESVLRVSPAWA